MKTGMIKTELSTFEIYPHTGTFFHYFMGSLTILFFMPVSILLFPFLLFFKIVFSLMERISFLHLNSRDHSKIRMYRRVVDFYHFCIFKFFYFHNILWTAPLAISEADGSWYGADISECQDYEDYMATRFKSKIRWKFRKQLKIFRRHNIKKEIISGNKAFFKILFSPEIFKLIAQASFRKNREVSRIFSIYFIFREYQLMFFLPVRLHLFKKNDKYIGFSSYLKRGNTLTLCQAIISNNFTRSGIFFEQVKDLILLGFKIPGVRYLSCGISSDRAKKACGLYPINFLMTDEFRCVPFSMI